mmetsp:Transcript_18485/g.55192  ORF Transcript_18485/g.55192 Transcript_18485/m.55192 type:complete len:235 (-) Transcript_18485:256-960(-)
MPPYNDKQAAAGAPAACTGRAYCWTAYRSRPACLLTTWVRLCLLPTLERPCLLPTLVRPRLLRTLVRGVGSKHAATLSLAILQPSCTHPVWSVNSSEGGEGGVAGRLCISWLSAGVSCPQARHDPCVPGWPMASSLERPITSSLEGPMTVSLDGPMATALETPIASSKTRLHAPCTQASARRLCSPAALLPSLASEPRFGAPLPSPASGRRYLVEVASRRSGQIRPLSPPVSGL